MILLYVVLKLTYIEGIFATGGGFAVHLPVSCRRISSSGQYPQDSTILPSMTLKFSSASKHIRFPVAPMP